MGPRLREGDVLLRQGFPAPTIFLDHPYQIRVKLMVRRTIYPHRAPSVVCFLTTPFAHAELAPA
jgi:hypothetical protein